jgi:Fe-S cluster biogenesis protein NfuA
MPDERTQPKHERAPGGGPSADASTTSSSSTASSSSTDELRQQVERVLALIRPAVREDGGDVELVAVDTDGLVRVRLHGACVGCPSAGMTLHHGIERSLRAELGPHMRVEAVNEVRG